MTAAAVHLRPGAYADSVRLMQISSAAAQLAGVEAAMVAMATPLNLELLASMGFTVGDDAAPNVLVVAVRAVDDATLAAAITDIDVALTARIAAAGDSGGEAPARTFASAVRRVGPGLALISVPGPHVFTEAIDALEAGCDVMIFSDNVSVAHEIALKSRAAELGRLVMGPDCGTAVVGGVGLGFSHAVQPGPVGIVAASGTGAQQVLGLLDAAGVGVSACLGVGGRDLSAAVGGASTRAALDALDADPATELIMVVSKPADPDVAVAVRAHAATLSTPVHFALVAPGEPDLTAATGAVLTTLDRPVPTWASWRPADPPETRVGSLRGLFVGGTLCDEAMVIATDLIGPIRSNIPLQPGLHVDPTATVDGHLMIDFGDDELTVGRPHPMIDPSLRLRRLATETHDPTTAVVLLDVVLGYGAHPDPAADLAPVIAAATVPVVVALIGTSTDPQGLERQAQMLSEAGAYVFASNAAAARFAGSLVAGPS